MIEIAAAFIGMLSIGQSEPLPHLGSLTEQLRGPARVATAPDGSIFVSDLLNRHIARFDASGDLMDTWPVPEGPVGVAVHPDGRVFVSLLDVPKVAIYNSVFDLTGYLGEDEPFVSFVGPTDIDVATDSGRIYVVDAEGDRIYGFESDGRLVLTLGVRGRWPGEFIYPSAITIDEPHNRIVVADHDKMRLQLFTTAGVFLHQFGDRLKSVGGRQEGWMPRPQGLTVDAVGNIYVTDALMGTVRVFDAKGVELGKVVDYGHEPGQVRVPLDLAISSGGSRLYVVSTGSSRVEVYDTTSISRSETRGSTAKTGRWAREPDTVAGETASDGIVVQTLETSWDGPHIVEDRPDICAPCHGITGQPGGHGGTVEGQGVLCLSCHSVGGRALYAAIHERDLADPFGTNPAAADGRGRSHAWGVPAVNPLADAVGPIPRGKMAQYLDGDGNIKCSTCHNQHNTENGTSYLRVPNEADAMCKECHAPRDLGLGEGGSHPVGIPYPERDGEFPPVEELGKLFVNDEMVECTTCHAPHGADSGGANGGDGDGMLLRDANDATLCQTCHTEHAAHHATEEWEPTCRDCHDVHDTDSENIALIAREIDGAPVAFREDDTACGEERDYVHSICVPPSYDGICEVCHTATGHHRNSAEGDHVHNTNRRCTDCHYHSGGFLPFGALCSTCHGEPPDGTVLPNRAGSHAVHLTGVNGPGITDCTDCHNLSDPATHDNGTVSFASGEDADGDGDINLMEADVCDTCHSPDGPFDGVNDPVIGAKANWTDGVYDQDVLKAEKVDWCAGCHDAEGAVVHGVTAPLVMGDNETWGYHVAGHGRNHVICTDCHDPTLPHTDGVARTFSERFPLSPPIPKSAEERELDREAYNNGYRLRRIEGEKALAVPRDAGVYTVDDFRLCFSCHIETKILGVPLNYGYSFLSSPPSHLRLPAGVAQTNYRNEYQWGYGWWDFNQRKPANIHWNHIGNATADWDIDHDGVMRDSGRSCVTCHNPHGTRTPDGAPTPAMMMADLAISFGVYDDGATERPYGYIGSGEYYQSGGDLHCAPCHRFFGPGQDPDANGTQTRFYREPLDLHEGCLACHDTQPDGTAAQRSAEKPPTARAGSPASRAPACSTATGVTREADCLVCHDMRSHRSGRRAGEGG